MVTTSPAVRTPAAPVDKFICATGLGANREVTTSLVDPVTGTAISIAPGPTSVSRILSAANTTNATSAKASAGYAYRVIGQNARASTVYLKFYNKASAPTVGSDTPVMTIALQASLPINIDLGPFYFSTGIAYAMTTGSADADTGALTAADVLGFNLLYS